MQFALLIFAVLTVAGAFAGWRKSPLYSLKATLKLIGRFLLIVVVVMGASQAIMNGKSCSLQSHRGSHVSLPSF
jgi:hypothetical protein